MARNMRPSDLDPVAAAAAPITPDPSVGWGNFDFNAGGLPRSVVTSMGGRPMARREAMILSQVEAGFTPEEAARIVDAELNRSGPRPQSLFDADNTPEARAALAERVRGLRAREHAQGLFEADYDAATGGPEARAELAGMRPQGGLAPQRTPATAAQIRAAGYQSQAEPGPTSVDGSPVQQGERFTTIEDARDYSTRLPATDEQLAANQDARFQPSPKDEAMMARGFWPVYTADGRVSYMVGTGRSRLTRDSNGDGRDDFPAGEIPGAPGRSGVRLDLEETDPTQAGFRIAQVPGPTGDVYVYRQNKAAADLQTDYMRERALYRQARAAGMTPAELRAADPGMWGGVGDDPGRPGSATRDAVEAKRANDARNREAMWRAQMTLGGGRPTGAQKAAINMFGMLDDPNVDSWQKAVIAERMAPGLQGMTPIAADAVGAQNAMRLLNSSNLGAAGLLNPAANPLLQQQQRQAAITRADALLKRYPASRGGGFGGPAHYSSADVQAIRDIIEKEYPGMGDSAVAHIPVYDTPAQPAPLPPKPEVPTPPKPAGGRMPL